MLKKTSFITLLGLSSLILSNCSSPEKLTDKKIPSAGNKTDYTLIYLIHGDANYTFHKDGHRLQADEEALDEARFVAENATNGEVFIFHQKPEKNILFLFPKKDRTWYHYRGGELIEEQDYSSGFGGLQEEAKIYMQHAFANPDRKVFLYFGHEIPSETNLVYHQSQPELNFDTQEFAQSLYLFGGNFDLTVLSTCNNGNPLMTDHLSELTDYVVASPRNLHLSYLDTKAVQILDSRPDIPASALADSIARDSFKELTGFLQTMVTVGVYNTDITQTYIPSIAGIYRQHLLSIEQENLFSDNTDCRNLDVFNEPIPEEGTHVYFQPPAFGREAGMESHSPWGCKE